MPGAPFAVAKRRTEQWRSDFEQLEIDAGGRLVRATLSAGVSVCYAGNEPVAQALDRADAALYEAKDRGRNRVVHRPVEPEPIDLPRARAVHPFSERERSERAHGGGTALDSR